MTQRILLSFLFICLLMGCSQAEHASEYVNIPDEKLAESLRHELKLNPIDPISKKQLSELTEYRLPIQREIKSLKGLEYATGLKDLNISGNYYIKDISPLSKLTKLENLVISFNKVRNIKPLEKLTNLTELTLNDNNISNLKPLAKLTKLEKLYIRRNPISDITPLKNLKNLKSLWLVEIEEIRDISPIAGLTQLTALTLDNIHIDDLAPLAELKNLTDLRLNDNYITDISALSGLTNLTALRLYHNVVKDISPLEGLTNLTYLVLHSSINDISALAGMTKLDKLMLYANYITDITPLADLTNLTDLRLEDNQISDITPLADLTNLTTLRLHNNQISDITPLRGMTKLLLLELHKNKIQDVAPLADMTNLKGLYLGGNEITDISPLAGLTELTHLGLAYNGIKDLSVVENFKSLKHLSVKQNPVQDFTPLDTIRSHNPELHQPTRDRHYRKTPKLGYVYARHETPTGLPTGVKARLGKGGINIMRFSPDGTQLAVGTDVGLTIYDVATGNEKDFGSKITAEINAIAFSHDGRLLACGGASNPVIQIWNLQNGNELPAIPVDYGGIVNDRPIYAVTALAFAKDNNMLISLSDDGFPKQWDITTGSNTPISHIIAYLYSNVFSISYDGSKFVSHTYKNKLKIWDTSKDKAIATLKGHSRFLDGWRPFRNRNKRPQQADVLALDFSYDGKYVASGSKDMTVRLWDVERRKKRYTLKGHTGWVTAVAFSKDGNTVASGDTEGILRLWKTGSGNALATSKGHKNAIVALTFTPDGKTLASAGADGTIRFWEAHSGDEISIFATGHTESVKAVAFSLDGSTLSCATFNSTVQKYDVTTQKQISTFTADNNNQIFAEEVLLTPDASLLAYQPVEEFLAFNIKGTEIDKSYTINHIPDDYRIWDVMTGEELPTQRSAREIIISPNNKYIARSKWDQVIISDVKSGKELFQIAVENDGILFSPDSRLIVTGGSFHDPTKIWDVQEQRRLITLGTGDEPIIFSADGNILACGSRSEVLFWDVSVPTEPLPIGDIDGSDSSLNIRVYAISPDNTIFLEAHHLLHDWFCEAQIQLYDMTSGVRLLTLYGHTEPINALTFSPDGKTLASGSEDGTVLLWDWDDILNDVRLTNRQPGDR